MLTVGVRELKEKTSEIVRLVREEKREVQVTYRGKVVARITPCLSQEEARARSREAWTNWEQLGQEIGKLWPQGVSAVEAVREQRREL